MPVMLQAFFTERLLTDFLYSCYIPSPTSLLLGLAYNRIVLSVALNIIGLKLCGQKSHMLFF